MTIVLADAAPNGTGLLIVGVILLAMFLALVGIVVLLIRWVRRRAQS